MLVLPPDIEIAQSAPIQHIKDIASKIGIEEDDLEYYGKYKAKLPLSLINENPQGHLVLVTAIKPTQAGEGKTTMSIGLADGLAGGADDARQQRVDADAEENDEDDENGGDLPA